MQLDQDFVQAVRPAIRKVWNWIQGDIAECSNMAAVEVCLDCNNIVDIGNDRTAETLIDTAIKEHGLDTVYKFLSANIQLA
jgi:hypothetical protein